MAVDSQLPESPDFKALQDVAEATSAGRHEVFSLIGNLVFSWSNNESMLIYIMMLLLRTDQVSAALVFGTLNTTRARLDLVKRLAKANLRDADASRELKSMLKWFDAGTRIRNEFNHSMFVLDAAGAITHTHALRIEEKGGEIQFGASQAVDAHRLDVLRHSITSMSDLNKALWAFLPKLEAAMKNRSVKGRVKTAG